MFEYLMPALVMQTFPFTLLDQTHKGSVKRQIAYGAERSVPWGVSESAYAVRDRLHTYQYRSTLVLAARGDCRVAVRDAKWGAGVAAVFAEDARTIGPVQYLYRGHRSSQPPGLSLRLGRLQYEILDRVGVHSPMPVLVAFAGSPSCGDSQFGLADVRI